MAPADALLTIAALRQEVAQLRAAVQARNEFISIAGHELRNPLTSLLMTVQSMRRTMERQTGMPDQIVTGLVRLDRVVQHYVKRCDSMLDISRLSSDTYRVEWAETDVAALLRGVVEDLTPYAERAGSQIELAAPDTLEGMVALNVRDQGIGISAADQARIFSPFERAVSRQQQPGFGLGLWVVGRLATAMGGTVQVSSDLGQGSTFSVRLPRHGSTSPA